MAVLTNPELWAAVGAARAQVEKARSDRDRVYAGVREEQLQALQREIEKAQALHRLPCRNWRVNPFSPPTLRRIDAGTGRRPKRRRRTVSPTSRRRGALCRGSARPDGEERGSPTRRSPWRKRLAMSSRRRRRSCCCARLRSGKVAILAAELGEAVVPGEPVLTIVPDDGLWFGFNMREDALRGLALGASVPVLSSLDRPSREAR